MQLAVPQTGCRPPSSAVNPCSLFDRSRRYREIGHGDQNMVKLGGVPFRGHGR